MRYFLDVMTKTADIKRLRPWTVTALVFSITSNIAAVNARGGGGEEVPSERVLLVSSFTCAIPGCQYENAVLRYDYATGEFQGVHIADIPGPYGMAVHPERGTLLVVSRMTDSVREYNLNTGVFIQTLVAPGDGGLHLPQNILFKPDGNFLVTSSQTAGYFDRINGILEYDPNGHFVGVFVDGGFQGINCGDPKCLLGPNAMVFGPNGNVFVASGSNNLIIEYDTLTSAYVGYFDSTRLIFPSGLIFRPPGTPGAGRILVTSKYVDPGNPSDTHKIVEFDPVTRELIPGSSWKFASGFKNPGPLIWHDSGFLMVGDRLFWDVFPLISDKIVKLDAATGSYLGTFTPVNGTQLHWSTAILDVEIRPPNVDYDYDRDGDVDLADACALQNCFGDSPSEPCLSAFDDNQNGQVELVDLTLFPTVLAGPQS